MALILWLFAQILIGLVFKNGVAEEVMSPEKLAEYLKTNPDLWQVN